MSQTATLSTPTVGSLQPRPMVNSRSQEGFSDSAAGAIGMSANAYNAAPTYTQQAQPNGAHTAAPMILRKPSDLGASQQQAHGESPRRLPSSVSTPLSLSAQLPVASNGAGMMIHRPAVIEYQNMRFLIHDAPTDSNLGSYLEYMKKKKVVALVRACEPTYDKTPLLNAGIAVHELPFADGSPPPDHIITEWIALVQKVFNGKDSKDKDKSSSSKGKDKDGKESKGEPKAAIAVHCVAGLGRAPILVSIALMEVGMGWMEVVELVRKKRRGALNLTQLQYLENYKPRKKDSCTIM